MLIVEVERREDGDREKIIAEFNVEHGKAEFHAQVMCAAINKHVDVNSGRYYKVVSRIYEQRKEAA